jgi:hypothetical protein
MRFVPRLPLPVKLAALALMGGFLGALPLIDARELLAHPGTSGPSCSEDRYPIVDRLLPEGAGGTVFVDDLGNNAGVALQASGTIELARNVAQPSVSETELHERAHLLEFAQPDIVARLMRGQKAPAAGQYAATSPVEHFGEMAGHAWQVVQQLRPIEACVMDSPPEFLRKTDQDVPGTAGFVLWYLRDAEFAAMDGADALLAEAERLTVDRSRDWQALYAALRAREFPSGGFRVWPEHSVRDYLERRRAHVRLAGGFGQRIEAIQITASLAILGLTRR